jgi:hypothetical protein
MSVVERWVGDGLAEWQDDRVVLTAEGWLVMDRLTVEFDDMLTGRPTLPEFDA